MQISKSHFWIIDGIWDTTFAAQCTFEYNANPSNGRLDEDLLPSFPEDSLVLMFRKNPSQDWRIINTNHIIGSKNDRRGTFTIPTIEKGEYAFAGKQIQTSNPNIQNQLNQAPFIHLCYGKNWCISNKNNIPIATIIVYDINGKMLLNTTNENLSILSTFPNGLYIYELKLKDQSKFNNKLIINN